MTDEHEVRPTANPALDKFMANFNDQDKWRAQLENVEVISKQLNEGAPIPTVSARDLRQLWDATHRMNADMSPKPGRAIGLAVYAAEYGVEAACHPEEFFSISWRYQLLSTLVKRGVLNDYKHGEELDEKVFHVAATMPCDKEDLGEAMLPMFLAQYPPGLAAKAREEMRAAGYDETNPNVGAKFLDLLRKHD